MAQVANHYVVGYGSLLSEESRQRFSDMECQAIPLTLHGWRRAWLTRSPDEKQTYVGAQQDESALLNGVLLEIGQITPSLQKREQDYQFVEVNLDQIDFHLPEKDRIAIMSNVQDKPIWICQTLYSEPADQAFPIYQSYIDTCLIGCLETEIDDFIHTFIESTELWHHHWINDRVQPQYPRAASMSQASMALIDGALNDNNILAYRREWP